MNQKETIFCITVGSTHFNHVRHCVEPNTIDYFN